MRKRITDLECHILWRSVKKGEWEEIDKLTPLKQKLCVESTKHLHRISQQ